MKHPYLSLCFVLSLAIGVASDGAFGQLRRRRVPAPLQLSCHTDQITSTAINVINRGPSISADGTHIAFVSNGDFTGQNNDSVSVPFLFNTRNDQFSQVAFLSPGLFGVSRSVLTTSINADGTRIAFVVAATSLIPTLFLADRRQGTVTPILIPESPQHRFAFGAQQPSINADGTRIAFVSDGDPTGSNADQNREIFLYDIPAGEFTQITNTPRISLEVIENSLPSISADGTRIAFVSHSNLTGENAEGRAEIFLYDIPAGEFTQITHNMGENGQPSINADGTRIAFRSRGRGPFCSNCVVPFIYLFDTTNRTFTQVTDASGSDPSINADGTLIAFAGFIRFLRFRLPANIFLFEGCCDTTAQVTDANRTILVTPARGQAAPQISISADGLHIAFVSTSNPTGQNPENNPEIFLTSCESP